MMALWCCKVAASVHSDNLENLTTGCDMRRADAGWDDHHYHDKYKDNGSDYGGDVADDDGAACEGQ